MIKKILLSGHSFSKDIISSLYILEDLFCRKNRRAANGVRERKSSRARAHPLQNVFFPSPPSPKGSPHCQTVSYGWRFCFFWFLRFTDVFSPRHCSKLMLRFGTARPAERKRSQRRGNFERMTEAVKEVKEKTRNLCVWRARMRVCRVRAFSSEVVWFR